MSATTRLHPSDAVFATGNPEEQRAARDEYRRQQRLQAAMRSGMQELERSDLEFGRFHITHRPSGQLFHVTRGEQFAGQYDTATAYYVTAGQEVAFLEPHPAARRQSTSSVARAAGRAGSGTARPTPSRPPGRGDDLQGRPQARPSRRPGRC